MIELVGVAPTMCSSISSEAFCLKGHMITKRTDESLFLSGLVCVPVWSRIREYKHTVCVRGCELFMN